MLKIYGVTFDHTLNYGSSLQAYALQTAIESIGIYGEQCEYRLIPLLDMPEHPNYRYGINKLNIIKKIPGKIFISFNLHRFKLFESSHMRYVDCHSFSDLTKLNHDADAFVCGSDVIWNPDQNKGQSAYYLDFAKKYKFSYAASFGNRKAEYGITMKQKEYLLELNTVSCREKSSSEAFERITKRKATVVADPVILLGAEKWNENISKNASKNKYIFSYTTHYSPTYESFLRRIEKQTGLKIKKCISTYKLKEAIRNRSVVFPSPQQWLRELRDAEYVITNSFHATAFSVLFHKKFFTVVQGAKDQGINVRMNDFLHSIHLDDRIFESVPNRIDTNEIDFSVADMILAQQRKASLEFLQSNLEAAYQEKQKLAQKGQTV